VPEVYDSYPGRCVRVLLFTAPMPAVGPTQPPTQCVLHALSLGIKRLQREIDYATPIDEV
jgi:hypothetical protein